MSAHYPQVVESVSFSDASRAGQQSGAWAVRPLVAGNSISHQQVEGALNVFVSKLVDGPQKISTTVSKSFNGPPSASRRRMTSSLTIVALVVIAGYLAHLFANDPIQFLGVDLRSWDRDAAGLRARRFAVFKVLVLCGLARVSCVFAFVLAQ